MKEPRKLDLEEQYKEQYVWWPGELLPACLEIQRPHNIMDNPVGRRCSLLSPHPANQALRVRRSDHNSRLCIVYPREVKWKTESADHAVRRFRRTKLQWNCPHDLVTSPWLLVGSEGVYKAEAGDIGCVVGRCGRQAVYTCTLCLLQIRMTRTRVRMRCRADTYHFCYLPERDQKCL